MLKSLIPAVAVALLSAQAGAPAVAKDLTNGPIVVELFTSQGCSACVDANVFAGELTARDDVIVLSYGVSYWDYLGWRDTFAKPEFADRQRAYAFQLANRRPYTPQMVVDGHVDRTGFARARVATAVSHCQEHPLQGPALSATRADGVLSIALSSGDAPDMEADVWLVSYRPGESTVSVGAGENDGAAMKHYNVVQSVVRVGGWSGQVVEIEAVAEPGMAYAVLVQGAELGPMLTTTNVADEPAA